MTERLYYDDSFLKCFEAEVVDIREHARREGASEWHIALNRSAFYPTSGGQPHDLGRLTATARSGTTLDVDVLGVHEDDAGEVWHVTSKPLLAGTNVTGTIDWQRRLDHMQQHSGQHLLSAVCAAELRAATVSFHLGEEASTIDLAVDAIAAKDLQQVEDRVNLAIAENLAVSTRTIAWDEAQLLLASGGLRKLPEREGAIRLVEIPGIDLNACGGTHVRALGQIGSVLLRGTEKVRQGVRLSFVCGLRAVRAARADDQVLALLSKTLSIHRTSLPETIDRKQAELKSAAKERQKLYENLADFQAAQLMVENLPEHGIRIAIRIVEKNFVDRDAAYIKMLALRLTAASPSTVVILSASQQQPSTIVFARSKDVAGLHCGEWLGSVLAEHGSRGGGSAELAQGQAPKHLEQAIASALRERAMAEVAV